VARRERAVVGVGGHLVEARSEGRPRGGRLADGRVYAEAVGSDHR